MNRFRVTATASVLRSVALSNESAPVFGLLRESEGTVLILSTAPDPNGQLVPVGTLAPSSTGDDRPDLFHLDDRRYQLSLVGERSVETAEIQDVEADLDLRRAGLLADGGLAHRKIFLAGGGSLGSKTGLPLAEAGVGLILVADRDRIDASNLSRHTCDLHDIGRDKAVALADQFRRRGVMAESLVVDILEMNREELEALVDRVDVVVATMDSPAAQFTINEVCVDRHKPAVFAGAYERACGGEVVVVQPGQGPCLYCAVGFRSGLEPSIEVHERRPAYQDTHANQLNAEPGLSVDIGYLASVAAAHVLALLDPTTSRDSLRRPDRGFVLLHGGSEPRGDFRGLFHEPFEYIYAQVRRGEPCPICGWTSLLDTTQVHHGAR